MTGVLRVSITGVLPNNENWSVNPCFALPTGDFPLTFSELDTIADDINDITFPSGIRALWNVETGISGVKLEHRELDGTLLAQYEKPRPGVTYGTSPQNLPMQTSLVTSLRTASGLATARGRMYWPITGATLLPGTLRVDPSVITAFQTAVKTYLSGLVTAVSTTSAGAELVVWSRTTASTAEVNRLLAGDIPDVQRRRRDKAIEAYNAVSFP